MLAASQARSATIAALVLVLAACSSRDPHVSTTEDSDTCAAEATVHTKVYGGSAGAMSLSMSAAQTLAVVAVVIDRGESNCTGVLISPEVVVTAAHCVAASEPDGLLNVVLGDSIRAPVVELPVLATETHRELDVAALRVSVPECARAEPIPLPPRALDDSWVGTAVEIAGFGWIGPDSPTFGERFFADETIVDLELDHLVVASSTMSSGACLGDSGGPALALVGDEVVLLGTLDDGDSSCMGKDYYVRVDRLADWLPEVNEAWGL
jgi:hypothetical protein